MTCKDCVHYELCKYNTYQEAHYFGKDKEIYITIDNNSPCIFFKNKADFVEVRHGEWEYWQPDGTKHLWKCSVCNNAISTPMHFVAKHIAYCEHCGAKMNEERKDEG